MPTFETPQPISVALELGVGNVRITASDRTDTTVEVLPSDDSNESDVHAAQQVRLDYANGVLQIMGPKARLFDFSRKTRSVEVSIDLPVESQVSGEAQVGNYSATGRLGQCRFKTSTGNVRLEQTGPLRVDTSAGHVTADSIAGNAEIHTGTGRIRIGEIDGSASVKNSNGDTEIAAVTGDLQVRSANGAISIGRAGASVDTKTSNGSIHLGEVARGSVELGTSMGELEIGIAEGTAAWLDVNTGFGQVRNLLTDASGPEDSDDTVEVRAHTSMGGITIRRS